MVANAVTHNAPYDEVIALHDVPRRIRRILRLEDHHTIAAVQTLAHRLAVNGSNHDVAVLSLTASVYDDQVTRVDACALHTVAFNFYQIHMGRAEVE
ncbi:hypothetical protein D3C80_1347150 [compost metagenome]